MDNDDLEFEKLYINYRPKILRYLTRLVGSHEAEDLTQDVFIKVNHALKDFKGESQVSTWIYRIATNAAIDRLRSPSFKKSAQKISPKTQGSNTEEEVEHNDIWTDRSTLHMDEILVRKEMRECFMEFVHKLPLDYRTVFILSDLSGMTNQEIAERLGISLALVKIRLHRGRTRLRKEFEAHCGLIRDSRNKLLWSGKRP